MKFGIAISTVLLAGSVVPVLATAQARPIDTQRSSITVRVYKSGLFSAFADNHEIRAPISEGTVDESRRDVSLVIKTQQLKVLDPGLPPEKRAEVQTRMLGPEVLDSERFKEIRFQSTKVEAISGNGFRVNGMLSLQGKTLPVALDVTGHDGSYQGQSVVKQRDFGIKPVSIAGGTVKVKDQVKIEFTIVTAAP